MKLPDREMSNCLYCNFPFEFVEEDDAKQRRSAVNQSRLQRVEEHPEFEGSVAAQPPRGAELNRAEEDCQRGFLTIVLGIGAGGIAFGLAKWLLPEFIQITIVVLAVITIFRGMLVLMRGSGQRKKLKALPTMARAAVIVDRRSQTEMGFWDGDTTYVFEIEFKDGVIGEFRWPGLGTHTGPYSTGITGVAYTRGNTLIGFKQLRV